jgi:hypothetical protein
MANKQMFRAVNSTENVTGIQSTKQKFFYGNVAEYRHSKDAGIVVTVHGQIS